MTTSEAAAAGAVAGGMITFFLLIVTAIYVLFIIAWWKIFTKAGIAGWKSIIPFYSQYTLFRISGMSGWWILLPLIASIFFACAGGTLTQTGNTYTLTGGNTPMLVIGVLGAIASGIVQIVQLVKLAGAFKKGTGFKVASVFFPNITALILAFGSAKYDKKALHA